MYGIFNVNSFNLMQMKVSFDNNEENYMKNKLNHKIICSTSLFFEKKSDISSHVLTYFFNFSLKLTIFFHVIKWIKNVLFLELLYCVCI